MRNSALEELRIRFADIEKEFCCRSAVGLWRWAILESKLRRLNEKLSTIICVKLMVYRVDKLER